MSKLMKVCVVAAFILSLISVSASLMFSIREAKNRKFIKEKDMNMKKQLQTINSFSEKMKNYDNIISDNKILNGKVSDFAKRSESADSEINRLKDAGLYKDEEIKKLKKEKDEYVNQSKNMVNGADYLKRIEVLNSKITVLEADMGVKNTELSALLAKVKKMDGHLAVDSQKNRENENSGVDLSSKVDNIKVTMESANKQADSEPDQDIGKSQAKIEVVNKDMRFVVFSMGEVDGVKQGDMMNVYKGKRFLGEIFVDEVFENMSSASVSDELMDKNVSEGDIVRKSDR